MLLSRVAETVYWMVRYIERAENTARIVMVNTTLLLDLPRTISLGWEPLLAITGSQEQFSELYKECNERNIVRFLIGDQKNPGSILASLNGARENLRTTRAIVPREVWEALNDLFLFAKEGVSAGLSRRGRFDYLKQIIGRCQQITGTLTGTMSHDEAYWFTRMGRNLERADMTTRIIDVGSARLMPRQVEELKPFADIQWMNVLKSLTAYQMYRRHVHVRVKGSSVVGYLLQDCQFPRAICHCLNEVDGCLRELPRSEGPLRTLGRAQRLVKEAEVRTLVNGELHQFIDDLQLALIGLHEQVASTYFNVQEPLPEPMPMAAAG